MYDGRPWLVTAPTYEQAITLVRKQVEAEQASQPQAPLSFNQRMTAENFMYGDFTKDFSADQRESERALKEAAEEAEKRAIYDRDMQQRCAEAHNEMLLNDAEPEFINGTDLDFEDITSELYRTYVFAGDNSITIEYPTHMAEDDNGDHLIYDDSGRSFRIPVGWLALVWESKAGAPSFVL
jgi:hypothetical protein